MFKGFILGILIAIVVAVAIGYAVLRTGVVPANADTQPSRLEAWAARTSLDAYLDREAPKQSNPIALTDENLIAGIKLYGKHCAFCHGTAKGEASATSVAKNLYPKPPQLASQGVENDPEGFSFWKIKHGIRWSAMPAWKETLTDEQIWTLALFLKHMDKLPETAEAEWMKVRNSF